MIEMTQELAQQALQAAFAKADEMGAKMGVTIVDEAGRLVLSARADGSGFYTFDTSFAKAVTSAAYKKSTMDMVNGRGINPHFFDALPSVIPGGALPTAGAVPIVRDGHIIGAIGIGGGAPDQDDACAQAGAAAIAG